MEWLHSRRLRLAFCRRRRAKRLLAAAVAGIAATGGPAAGDQAEPVAFDRGRLIGQTGRLPEVFVAAGRHLINFTDIVHVLFCPVFDGIVGNIMHWLLLPACAMDTATAKHD